MLHTGMFCATMWLNARMGMLSSCFIILDLLVMTLFSAGLYFVVTSFFSRSKRALYDDGLIKRYCKTVPLLDFVGVNKSLKTSTEG